jgi:phage shock protein B
VSASVIASVALLVFLTVVAPIWIVAHYATRWRMARTLGPEDEARLTELWHTAERLEERMRNLERILDAEVPDWRRQA